MKVVGGILQQCCRARFSSYFDCKGYAGAFNDLCLELGVGGCTIVHISCSDGRGHQMNSATIDGAMCLVEPQPDVVKNVTCVATWEEWDAAICAAMGKEKGCDCTYTISQGQSENVSYALCGILGTLTRPKINYQTKCETCCKEYAQARAGAEEDPAITAAFIADCKQACKDIGPSATMCLACKGKEGFVGTCDKKTCKQQYNTGFCEHSRSTTCKVISTICQNPVRDCENPIFFPSTSSSSSSSSTSSSTSSVPSEGRKQQRAPLQPPPPPPSSPSSSSSSSASATASLPSKVPSQRGPALSPFR